MGGRPAASVAHERAATIAAFIGIAFLFCNALFLHTSDNRVLSVMLPIFCLLLPATRFLGANRGRKRILRKTLTGS